MNATSIDRDSSTVGRKIPVGNIWLLFLYAFHLAQCRGRFDVEVEQSPDFKSLIAKLLCEVTEKRLRRNLSFGYRRREDVLRRVRGRIDILKSVSEGLFQKGEIACRFDELTINTPRNRLVRSAHSTLAGCEITEELSRRCQRLAHTLVRFGITGDMPSRAEIVSDQIARHEIEDRLMVSLAQAVFDLVLPTEEAGARSLPDAQRGEISFPKLFEKAIGNFYKVELSQDDGWKVFSKKRFKWPIEAGSGRICKYLPQMETDIILQNTQDNINRRIIIDTKFTEVLKKSQYGSRFKSNHLYQLYSYLRSQECANDPMSLNSDGILLYPSVGLDIDETVLMQGHCVRFVTVDLAGPNSEVIKRLKSIPISSALT